MSTVNWDGDPFTVHTLPSTPPASPGIYIFAKVVAGKWKAVYIGEADNIQERLANHERKMDINKAIPTHLHVLMYEGPTHLRKRQEKRLIGMYNPICNKQR